MALRNETQIVKYFGHRPEEDGHAHVSAYVYIETTTKRDKPLLMNNENMHNNKVHLGHMRPHKTGQK